MEYPELKAAVPLTLEQVLQAREMRTAWQQELLTRHQCTLVSFTLNLPGVYKQFPLARSMFREGVRLISRRLGETLETRVEENSTGDAAFFAVNLSPEQAKKQMVSLEQALPAGRLFDIDVLDGSGASLSREDLGLPLRPCLLCRLPAKECGRARTHPVEEVFSVAVELMRDYFDTLYGDRIAHTAMRALIYEVATTPKPGLVDRANNGAHFDMDFFTFTDSTAALLPYFRAAALAGLCGGDNPKELFRQVRFQGQLAEEEMIAATGGVNTHKGLIFSIGLLCAAAGALQVEDPQTKPSADMLLDYTGKLAAFSLEDFKEVRAGEAASNGERIYIGHGIGGVRAEAAEGFPHVRERALPALRLLTGEGHGINDAALMALAHLLATVQDTNIVHRGRAEALAEIHGRVAAYLEGRPTPQQAEAFLRDLDREFIQRNLSPGGCADQLAIALFLYLYSG